MEYQEIETKTMIQLQWHTHTSDLPWNSPGKSTTIAIWNHCGTGGQCECETSLMNDKYVGTCPIVNLTKGGRCT